MHLTSFSELDLARLQAGLSVHALCTEAGIADSTWRRIKMRPDQRGNVLTYRRLWTALERLKRRGETKKGDHEFLVQTFKGYVAAAAQTLGVPIEDALLFDHRDNKPKDPVWLSASRVRQAAIYLTCIEHDVGASQLASAIGLTKQAISKARHAVEDRRDDPEFDFLIERIGQMMTGRAA